MDVLTYSFFQPAAAVDVIHIPEHQYLQQHTGLTARAAGLVQLQYLRDVDALQHIIDNTYGVVSSYQIVQIGRQQHALVLIGRLEGYLKCFVSGHV